MIAQVIDNSNAQSAQTVEAAEYLFRRLKQLGVNSVHGVPGDYNLTLLDYVEPSGLHWVGNANELNAGYAADGYSRIKGVSALVTTYGVGELSAINAIACAYTESAPVIHIVGTPSRDAQANRLMIHHTLGDGDYRHFGQMASHVTVAQVNLTDPMTAPAQIDVTLSQCLLHSRPVYIEVPVDMVDVPVSAEGLRHELTVLNEPINSDSQLDKTLEVIIEKLHSAYKPIILVDGEARALGLMDVAHSWVTSTQWPTFTTISGKSLVDMSNPNVYGIYRGSYADSDTRAFVDSADLVLCFGAHFSSTNTYNWSSVPKPEKAITFTRSGVRICGKSFRHNSARHVAYQLLKRVDFSRLINYIPSIPLPRDELLSFEAVPGNITIKQDRVWRLLANFLRPGDILLGETGTSGYGVREMPLPSHTRLFTPCTWLSIGYMLPASQGAALAQRELIANNNYYGLQEARTILLIGDGSFQMTAQELATIIRLNLNVVIFLINNDGYTIERCIHGKDQKYNDVSLWRYLRAPALFGANEDSFTAQVRTYGELEMVLSEPKLADGSGLRMVELFLDREDAPAGPLKVMLDQQNEAEGQ